MLSLEPPPLRRAPLWRRSNPFATRFIRPGAMPFVLPAPQAIDELQQRFLELRRAAIVGPHGNGKSTLLQSMLPGLRQQFAQVHLWKLTPDDRCPAALWMHVARCQSDGLLIIDGFEQLPLVARLAITHWIRLRSGALLVTSHAEVPAMATLWQASVDHALARQLTRHLLAEYHDCQVQMMDRFERHWRSGQRNLRDLWFAMYDDFESLRQTPRDL